MAYAVKMVVPYPFFTLCKFTNNQVVGVVTVVEVGEDRKIVAAGY